jgi:Xaa-Pro aminopeptidase
MLGFETLTFAPIDRNLIEVALLTPRSGSGSTIITRKVLEIVGPQLEGDARP